jgi:hypothetical protein
MLLQGRRERGEAEGTEVRVKIFRIGTVPQLSAVGMKPVDYGPNTGAVPEMEFTVRSARYNCQYYKWSWTFSPPIGSPSSVISKLIPIICFTSVRREHCLEAFKTGDIVSYPPPKFFLSLVLPDS